MKKIKNIKLIILVFGVFLNHACTGDLDVEVKNPNQIVGEEAYQSLDDYTSGIAKVYAGLTLSGQQGPGGAGDIGGIDEGFGQYMRAYWQLQQLPTDETKVTWNDGTIQTLNFQTWSSESEFVNAAYSRFLYEVGLANQFLRDSEENQLESLDLDSSDKEKIEEYRAEARWLRALAYSHALDLFGNVPFKTEEDPVGGFVPPQASRAELFEYIESELLEIESDMTPPKESEYGRVDRAAAWALLAKLYLNAEVYIGEPKYEETVTYTEKIMDAGYSLANNYEDLFRADNNTGDTTNEIIFGIPSDARHTQSNGGTNFIINASVDALASEIGVPGGGWGGIRTTKNLVYLFNKNGDVSKVKDDRGIEYKDGDGIFNTQEHELEMEDVTRFKDGYGVIKFKNLNSDGSRGAVGENDASMASVDFPLFRLGDVYLMWTEAKLKTGTPDATYVNMLRSRAHAKTINDGDIDEDFILDERGRELYWEATRRTDLIRFGKFTGSAYLWPWKGDTSNGTGTEEIYNLYPIPISDLSANPELEQNPGY